VAMLYDVVYEYVYVCNVCMYNVCVCVYTLAWYGLGQTYEILHLYTYSIHIHIHIPAVLPLTFGDPYSIVPRTIELQLHTYIHTYIHKYIYTYIHIYIYIHT